MFRFSRLSSIDGQFLKSKHSLSISFGQLYTGEWTAESTKGQLSRGSERLFFRAICETIPFASVAPRRSSAMRSMAPPASPTLRPDEKSQPRPPGFGALSGTEVTDFLSSDHIDTEGVARWVVS